MCASVSKQEKVEKFLQLKLPLQQTYRPLGEHLGAASRSLVTHKMNALQFILDLLTPRSNLSHYFLHYFSVILQHYITCYNICAQIPVLKRTSLHFTVCFY